ncbi:hypothetical protein PIB30_061014 [Stylosanthes scabra]|uniref:Uncharacterized protein n=1 Tax=Stylosanthes scabra TaxID=79078 RepID=A0ABU6TM20_9FABA|nr:hypothetical protein [Stylosanthes scabra]
MSTMPQHTQNVRYQSPYLRQQFPSGNDPPNKYEEVERIRQKESQEMMEMQNQITSRLNQIAEMLQKSTSQPIQHQPPTPIPNPLPSQPLPDPKGFLNPIHDEVTSEDESEDTDNEETKQHLYELLLEMVESKDERGADNEELMGFCEEYGSAHEDSETDQEKGTEDEWKKEMQTGKTTERFQIVKKGKDHSLQKDDGRMRGKESAQTKMIKALAKGWVKMLKEELEGSSCAGDRRTRKRGRIRPMKNRWQNSQMAPRKDKAPQMLTRFSRRLAALKARQTKDETGPSNAAPRDDEIINISSDSEQEQEYVQEEEGEIEEEEVSGYGALIEVLQPLSQEEPEDIPYDGPEDGEIEEEEEDPEEDFEDDPEEDPEEEPEEEQEEDQDWVEEDEMEEEEENEEEEDVTDLHPGVPDYDEYFHYYFKLGPPPNPASDEESDDE